MSYLQFPEIRAVHVVDTAETLLLGEWKPANNGELKHVRLNLYAKGLVSGLWQAKARLHLNTNFTVAYAESDLIFLTSVGAAIDGAPTGDWIAMVRFDFGRPNLNKNQTYQLTLQLPGYTRVADTNYIAAVKDQPYPVYNAIAESTGWSSPAHFAAFSFQEDA